MKLRGRHILQRQDYRVFINLCLLGVEYMTLNMRGQLVHEFKEGNDHWYEIRRFKKCSLKATNEQDEQTKMSGQPDKDRNG